MSGRMRCRAISAFARTPIAPAVGALLSATAPGGVAAGPSAPGPVSGLAVTAAARGPITVVASVPAGAKVVRIRVFRLGSSSSLSRAASARGWLVATVFRATPKAKRYRFRLTERKLRRLQPGRYRIELRAGRSRAVLGAPSNRTVQVRRATGGARG